ncbi:hypothetical protein [Halobacillus karajensis]|uniref:Uncharacterized protein n=1 Tax=Halobacillus karajensis TaxID=195088 RepID=A0A059NUY2_9BACI|nr:hypothetical protein [Halobacillus karajensis]CDQ22594.1 hypothetical protein BN983_00807 [Halobacillus karajensis]CDQ26076.1 hypothetical protein BN981_00287 [Halobacillus karajensis]
MGKQSKSTWWYEAKYDELKSERDGWKKHCLFFIATNIISLAALLAVIFYG